MKKLTVCIVTGTRAEFGIWRPVLAALNASKLIHTKLLVTGMHLLKSFGQTERDIAAAGFSIDARAPMYNPDEPAHTSLARGTQNIGNALAALTPDLVFLLGDRLEMLAAANAALAARIPIAHLHGGESAAGIWDEQIRHAITKMAHLHFCATKAAAKRIERMGEDPKTIHLVGAPALDLARTFYADHATRAPRTGALLVLHPSSADESLEESRTRTLIRALKKHELPIHLIGPNNDPGYPGILRAYESEGLRVLTSIPQETFWQHLLSAQLLVGNSSSGIIEAATFALPVVNVGDRQAGRERNPNVLDTNWSPQNIDRALATARTSKPFLKAVAKRQNLYGDGKASQRILAVLEKIAHTNSLSCVKRFAD